MCTKFHAVWFAAADKLQKEFINEFSSSNAKYILMDAPLSNAEKYQPYGGAGKLGTDGIAYEKRYALIDQYLKKNFKFHNNDIYKYKAYLFTMLFDPRFNLTML